MALRNSFIGYNTRSYEQIKEDILLKFGANVPEITDHTDSNIWVKGINIFAGIAEMLNYYSDVRAREVFLSTARLYESAVELAKFFDYRIKGSLASSVDLKFFIDAPTTAIITIPQGTNVSTKEGISFLTSTLVTIPIGNTEVNVAAVQHTLVSGVNFGTSDGSKNQEYILEEKVVDGSMTVLVDTNTYTQKDTFAEGFQLDEIYVAGLNADKQMVIEFGDGINGLIPPSTQLITGSYYISEGSDGNVGSGSITEINDTITVPTGAVLKLTNVEAASGGINSEELKDLQKNIPLANRTKYRAVTPQDYIDVTELAPGVEKAGVSYDCASIIEAFIVPDGGGIASSQLIIDTEAFLLERKIMGRKVTVKTAGQVIIKFNITVYALANAQSLVLEQDVKDAISDFLSSDNQKISGSVQLNDVVQVVENTIGVSYSEFKVMKAIPFARPLNSLDLLDWDREIQDESYTTKKWNIRFTNTSNFELKYEGNFIGTFSTGVEVVLTDIKFTVNGNYTAGNQYEFYTYKSFGSIKLTEPSIPASDQVEMTINVIGGI